MADDKSTDPEITQDHSETTKKFKLNHWQAELLKPAIAARQAIGTPLFDTALFDLAQAVHRVGFELYRTIGISDEDAQVYLLRKKTSRNCPRESYTHEEVQADLDRLVPLCWFYRAAFAMVNYKRSAAEFLEDFYWEGQLRTRDKRPTEAVPVASVAAKPSGVPPKAARKVVRSTVRMRQASTVPTASVDKSTADSVVINAGDNSPVSPNHRQAAFKLSQSGLSVKAVLDKILAE